MKPPIPTAVFALLAAVPLTAQSDALLELTKQQVNAAQEIAEISRAQVKQLQVQSRKGSISARDVRAAELAAWRAELSLLEHRLELVRLTQKGDAGKRAQRKLLEERIRVAKEITATLESEAASVAALVATGRLGATATYRVKKAILEAKLVELACRKDLVRANPK